MRNERPELRTVSPPPSSQPWSSRDLAAKLFYDLGVDATAFDSYPSRPLRDSAKAGLSLSKARGPRAPRVPTTPDAMDVDDFGDGVSYAYQPSHPLDVLHLEIIDHFTPPLRGLVDLVGGSDVPRGKGGNGISQSQYAPDWSRVPLDDWTAKDCLEYLDAKHKGLGLGAAKLPQFMTRPYTKKAACRIGQEWTRQEWVSALEALQRVGERWQAENILESMRSLGVHAMVTFGLQMRPTGT
ncbi:hypothetical protein OF83DRAFT_1093495 [Amylostereum chailletii]|nr:hypothetical protein OF83DRAFT_1093495 [Amylostereum chailletii]